MRRPFGDSSFFVSACFGQSSVAALSSSDPEPGYGCAKGRKNQTGLCSHTVPQSDERGRSHVETGKEIGGFGNSVW